MVLDRFRAAWRVFRDPALLTRRGFIAEPKASRWSRLRFVLTPLKGWPLFAGVGLFVVALALERIALFSADPAHANEVAKQSILNFHNVILVVSELGFAFVIAWVVSLAIEAGARAQQNRAVEEAIKRIGHDVFEGALGIKHDKAYVRSVIETCLDQPLTRELYRIHYRIEPFPAGDAERLGIENDRFVLVHAKISYTVRNAGRNREVFRMTYGIPCRSGDLRDFSRLTALVIGDARYPNPQEAAQFELPADAVEPEFGANANDRNYRFAVELDASETVDIVMNATLVKEMSDSDTFGFSRPTTGAIIQITSAVLGLRFGVQARTSSKLQTVSEPDGGNGEWQIDGSILPYQSVNLWWRSAADDGAINHECPGQPLVDPDVPLVEKSAAVHISFARRMAIGAKRLFGKEKADENGSTAG